MRDDSILSSSRIRVALDRLAPNVQQLTIKQLPAIYYPTGTNACAHSMMRLTKANLI
jgi:hypothetical protein